MDWEEWESIYIEILDDMGYDAERDEKAGHLLASLCDPASICDEQCLSEIIGKEVTVVGNAPDLEEILISSRPIGTLFVADGAMNSVVGAGLRPDILVTDLDGDVETEIRCNLEGTVAVIHAHGDNMDALRRFVPLFHGMIVPTVQCHPFGMLRNFGGFTDGDRCVLLAHHFGARIIHLIGFDFEKPRKKRGSDPDIKTRKLEWARRMILGLEGEIRIDVIG
jgi:hypothetical protein